MPRPIPEEAPPAEPPDVAASPIALAALFEEFVQVAYSLHPGALVYHLLHILRRRNPVDIKIDQLHAVLFEIFGEPRLYIYGHFIVMFRQIEEAVYGFSKKIVKARYDDFAEVVLYTVCSERALRAYESIDKEERLIDLHGECAEGAQADQA
jgi:hypothetical protein